MPPKETELIPQKRPGDEWLPGEGCDAKSLTDAASRALRQAASSASRCGRFLAGKSLGERGERSRDMGIVCRHVRQAKFLGGEVADRGPMSSIKSPSLSYLQQRCFSMLDLFPQSRNFGFDASPRNARQYNLERKPLPKVSATCQTMRICQMSMPSRRPR